MKMITCVKRFFEANGLKWNGKMRTGKQKEFRPATEEDFENLKEGDYLIDFGKDGEIALACEIDLITFKIHGETFDCGYSAYAGDIEENKILCEERDLSKQFIEFQLKNRGLIYAVLLKKKCEEEKERVHVQSETQINLLEKKINLLNRRIDRIKNEEIEEINHLNDIEKMVED